MKKYYEVLAKGGHVGRNYYTEVVLYIVADSASDAAEKARWTPRIKHHDKYAILSVSEISWNEYKQGRQATTKNPYFTSHNRQEQRQSGVDLPRVRNETEIDNIMRNKDCKRDVRKFSERYACDRNTVREFLKEIGIA